MKERIRQILREETSGLDPKMLNTAYKMMNNLTKGCHWYFDTPKQRFEYTPESIWLINPNTKQWMLEFKKSGTLLYYYEIYLTFRKYFNMELSDFESFIMLWVEDALKIGVSTTLDTTDPHLELVEDVLKIGVSTTLPIIWKHPFMVEDALKIGVSTTWRAPAPPPALVEDVLKKGKKLR